MKHIVLAPQSKRIFSGLIDLVILIGFTLVIFFSFVLPFGVDYDKYIANSVSVMHEYEKSGLVLSDGERSYGDKTSFLNVRNKIEDLYKTDLEMNDVLYRDQNLSKDLYEFYTTKLSLFNEGYNLSRENYLNDVLKVGKKDISNIKEVAIDDGSFKITMFNDQLEVETISYFIGKYSEALKICKESKQIKTLEEENNSMMLGMIVWIIPILIGVGAIFNLVIPLLNDENKTIGKYIFKLGVISSDGYKLKKSKLVIRFIVYIFVEVLLGFATFGGTFLISYTMFMFAKKHRCLHDFAAKSCVISSPESFYFTDAREERYYLEREKFKNVQ